MSPLALVVIAFVIGLFAMSLSFSGGAVIVALPIALLIIAAVAVIDLRRRARKSADLKEFRKQAKAQTPEFSERDQETLVSE
jgi:hypothetical protein